MGETKQVPLTVAVDMPSARVLAQQASVVADLEFVMECCKRLLTELSESEAGRDDIVPLALWSSALLAYGRCFGENGLKDEDVEQLPLQGEVLNFHKWITAERDKVTENPADPFETAKIGAVLTPATDKNRRIEGIAVFSNSRVLIDVTGVRQLGGLASELAKRTAGKAQKQQDVVLADTQQMDIDRLYEAPSLL